MVKIKDIANALEMFAPLPLQEGYDNAGLQVGLTEAEVAGVLLCLDVTEKVVDEAIASGCNLIVSHHPLIFSPLKKIAGRNDVERCVIKALQNGIAIYSSHTNIDSARGGVNYRIANILGLQNVRILVPKEDSLLKLAVYVPLSHADAVRKALFDAGCGHIGNYDSCSYNINGFGTFKASEVCNPFCGEIGKLHKEDEVRIETIMPAYIKSKVIASLLSAHPYEEPAFDIYPLKNSWEGAGLGVVGDLPSECDEKEFLNEVKNKFHVGCVRHTAFTGRKVKRVALCGGSGASFVSAAISAGAQVYITGEARYHEMFDLEGKILMAVIGHYESEQFTMDIFKDIINRTYPGVEVKKTTVNTNPINYL